MSNKIPFAYKNNKMVDVAEVDSGKACGCFCPSCEAPLQARKGEVNTNHFAHLPGSINNCEFAPETALHKMAKQIIVEEKRIILPPLSIIETQFDNAGDSHKIEGDVCKKSAIIFDSVVLEKAKHRIIPDVTAKKNGKAIYIEIYVTHKISKTKKDYIREKNIPTIELDLSKFIKRNDFSKSLLKRLVIDEIKNKKWIHHPNFGTVKDDLNKKIKARVSSSNIEYFKRLKERPPSRSFINRSDIATAKKRPSKPEVTKKLGENKILWCNYCNNVFEISRKIEIKLIDCPKCNRVVSQTVVKKSS